MESNRFVKLYKQGSTLGSSYLEIWVDRFTSCIQRTGTTV